MTGEDLKRRRETLGLSQTALARYWQTTQATISNWESGKHEILHEKIVDDALTLLEIREGEREKVEHAKG
jgi:DNA-binding transcriptional regulator YiaG